MTALDLALLLEKCADEGLEPLKAFTTATKAGMVGVKRDEFERKYAEMVSSPLLRRLAVRGAQEEHLANQVRDICLRADPGLEKAATLYDAYMQTTRDPHKIPGCMTLFAEYVDAAAAAAAVSSYEALWPVVKPLE